VFDLLLLLLLLLLLGVASLATPWPGKQGRTWKLMLVDSACKATAAAAAAAAAAEHNKSYSREWCACRRVRRRNAMSREAGLHVESDVGGQCLQAAATETAHVVCRGTREKLYGKTLDRSCGHNSHRRKCLQGGSSNSTCTCFQHMRTLN
jgi:hypothetical protein